MESLINLRTDLVLFCNQPLDVAGRVTQSDAKNFFDSKRYADWKKLKDHEYRMQSAMIDRLNGVIESIGALAKRRG
ncbi:hypothetical protein [Stutzerimonas nitrititolerans]|uniref:hypothetical protein n=1 Tax=Stutzerimonas nitrititolerans TaxID=2482751 RepID=UPI0028AE92A6|nr:hypothetical protein [Stutzerimonas nitrititolerans]